MYNTHFLIDLNENWERKIEINLKNTKAMITDLESIFIFYLDKFNEKIKLMGSKLHIKK